MKTIAIICEYNPFHNGHAYQLSRLREEHPDAVLLCIMSGYFTQRGEPAIISPYARAEAAIGGGADLVLELPQPWASASAEYFAAGGVAVAHGLGCVDGLAFGCESADPEAPMRVAEGLDSPLLQAQLAAPPENPAEGIAARTARLYRECIGDDGGMLSAPNNLLAVQYCRALRRLNSPIRPLPMLRRGSGYHDTALAGENPSATAVRRALRQGSDVSTLADYLPPSSCAVLKREIEAGRGPVFPDNLSQAILSFYRLADPGTLEGCASMTGGLHHRLISVAHEACSAEEMFTLAAAKHYTDTRLYRAVLQGMMGITPTDLAASPAWTLLLGASQRGLSLLRELRRRDSLPVITKPADIPAELFPRQAELHRRAAALYTLAMPTPAPSAEFIKYAPYIARS
ncbi:MAG: nucleotidyltransferase family protein [Ruminococcaceae bacterium]|nr:nucleotidyltransferase family protein [Oscillospiraceae bacterium]